MTAANAKILTDDRREAMIANRRLRTDTYVETVIYHELEYVADLGKRSLIHILPAIKLDNKYMVEKLTADEFTVRRFGRLLIIYW